MAVFQGIFTNCGHHTGMCHSFVLKCLPLLLAAPMCLAPQLPAWAQGSSGSSWSLPALGEDGDLSLSEERRIGDQIVRSIYRDPDYLDDPALMAYVQTIWRPLKLAAEQRGEVAPEMAERFAWTLLLDRNPQVNAFALPGGYMGVNLGLLATVATPDELASVLAHETSHVSQRHIARLLAKQGRDAPLMLAALVLGALAASKAQNADIASAAIVGGQAMMAQKQLNFSRDMEREADRVGFGVLTDAGYDGLGFVTMFDKLQQASRLNDDGAFPYLRSHPLTTERIADMQARVPMNAAPHPGQTVVSPQYHALMAARAKVLAENSVDRWRNLLQPGKQSGNALLGARYAATLAAAKLRDPNTALSQWQQLQALPVTDPLARQAIQWLRLEVLLELQDTPALKDPAQQKALQVLREQALASGTREGLILGARAAQLADATAQRQAAGTLQEWTVLHPRDALAWQTLAQLQAALQQPVLSARAEAEARWAQLDLSGALERFRSAQRLAQQGRTANHYELSILDARVRQVETELREQLCDDARRSGDPRCQRMIDAP